MAGNESRDLEAFELVIKPNETKEIEFPSDDDGYTQAVFANAVIDKKYDEETKVTVEFMDVESDAEDIDTAPIVKKKLDVVVFNKDTDLTKEIEFTFVSQHEAKFTCQGPGTVSLEGVFADMGEEEEYEEEEEEDKKK